MVEQQLPQLLASVSQNRKCCFSLRLQTEWICLWVEIRLHTVTSSKDQEKLPKT